MFLDRPSLKEGHRRTTLGSLDMTPLEHKLRVVKLRDAIILAGGFGKLFSLHKLGTRQVSVVHDSLLHSRIRFW